MAKAATTTTPTTTPSARDRLLEAADQLFYDEGVRTVGIDRVIERAGVAKASLYSTFGSKEELVREYLQRRDEQLRARIEQRLAGIVGPRERALAVFDSLRDQVVEGGYLGCAFIRASAEGAPGTNASRYVSALHRTWRYDLFARLAKELGVPDPRETSHLLSILYDGASTSASMDGDGSAPLIARKAAAHLLDAALANHPKPKKTPTSRPPEHATPSGVRGSDRAPRASAPSPKETQKGGRGGERPARSTRNSQAAMKLQP